MRLVLQRVTSGKVTIRGKIAGEIQEGFVVFLGVCASDTKRESDYLVEKLINLRVFEDEQGKMNRSLLEIKGSLLVISQFTLYADCGKGRRPSFIAAARPELANLLYDQFISRAKDSGIHTETGIFGENMHVSIENDGPVTIWLDTDEIMSGTKKSAIPAIKEKRKD